MLQYLGPSDYWESNQLTEKTPSAMTAGFGSVFFALENGDILRVNATTLAREETMTTGQNTTLNILDIDEGGYLLYGTANILKRDGDKDEKRKG